MKIPYTSPIFMATNGTINLTVSQLAELGIDIDTSIWNSFWYSHEDEIKKYYPDFDPINNYPEGFDLNDEETWDGLIYGDY